MRIHFLPSLGQKKSARQKDAQSLTGLLTAIRGSGILKVVETIEKGFRDGVVSGAFFFRLIAPSLRDRLDRAFASIKQTQLSFDLKSS
jgi:hypothetical protein